MVSLNQMQNFIILGLIIETIICLINIDLRLLILGNTILHTIKAMIENMVIFRFSRESAVAASR